MDEQNLIDMANRIGEFFESMPDHEEALAGVADHIRRFWEPRMRRTLLGALDQPGCRRPSDVGHRQGSAAGKSRQVDTGGGCGRVSGASGRGRWV